MHQIDGCVPAPYPPEWVALKLLEGDAEIARTMQNSLPAEKWEAVNIVLRQHDDALLAVASGRYEWIGRMVRAAVVQPRMGQISWTKRLDEWAAHPFWGLIILAGILGLVFWLTFTIGSPAQAWLDKRLSADYLPWRVRFWRMPPFWIRSIDCRWVPGWCWRCTIHSFPSWSFFSPFLACSNIRATWPCRLRHGQHDPLMGLHGRSFLPLFLGFGCNVPAILGRRVII